MKIIGTLFPLMRSPLHFGHLRSVPMVTRTVRFRCSINSLYEEYLQKLRQHVYDLSTGICPLKTEEDNCMYIYICIFVQLLCPVVGRKRQAAASMSVSSGLLSPIWCRPYSLKMQISSIRLMASLSCDMLIPYCSQLVIRAVYRPSWKRLTCLFQGKFAI